MKILPVLEPSTYFLATGAYVLLKVKNKTYKPWRVYMHANPGFIPGAYFSSQEEAMKYFNFLTRKEPVY